MKIYMDAAVSPCSVTRRQRTRKDTQDPDRKHLQHFESDIAKH